MRAITTLLILLSLQNIAQQGPKWRKITDAAPWPKSYNYQLLSIRDTLWVLHPRGTWYSTDGQKWKASTLSNPIYNHAFLDYVLFDNQLVGLGYFKGNIEQFQFRPIIFSTTNMRTWDTLSKASRLPQRFFYHPFVFNNQLWIIGGEDKQTKYADIWKSSNGVQWQEVVKETPLGKRSSSQVVALNNKLYLLNNDVWTSTDAIHWEKLTDAIVPGQEIFGYTAVVWKDQIWLLGCNRNGRFSSEVLYSKDGKKWQAARAPWSPRGGVAATVFKGKIYMTGGKYGGTPDHTEFIYSNDVWVLE